ncbi:MAG: ABC transporter substrate-binding protein [Chloroflexi bacterium]|nr:ABC transporter substrate-binding protein [Chloroflexota bacterium]
MRRPFQSDRAVRALLTLLLVGVVGCSSAPAPATAPAPAARPAEPSASGGASAGAVAPVGPGSVAGGASGTAVASGSPTAAAAPAKPVVAAPAPAAAAPAPVGAAAGAVAPVGPGSVAGAATTDTSPFLRDRGTATLAFSLATMDLSYSIIPVAEELFWEKEENLKVNVQLIAGSVPVVQAVETGSVDFGAATPEPTLTSHAKGGSKAIWAYSIARSPTGSLAVKDDSPIQSIADFRGKKIGAQALGSGNILLANGILASAGVKKEEVQYISIGVGAQALAAFQANQVDGLTLPVSQYVAFENQGQKLRFFTSPDAMRLFSTTGTTTIDVVKNKPDVLKALGRGLAKATVFIIENPEAAVRIHWKRYPAVKPTGVDEAKALADAINVVKRYGSIFTIQQGETARRWGSYAPESVSAWTTFAAENAITDKKVAPEGLFTNDFVDAYNQFNENRIKELARNYKG